jgi:FixJ family two-component response regulator
MRPYRCDGSEIARCCRLTVVDKGIGCQENLSSAEPVACNWEPILMCVQPIVYVVDDDLSVRRMFNRLLTAAGWRVEIYASGTAFLDAYLTGQCGCVVLDLRMPEMSGLEVRAQLCARGSSISVVIVTAFSDIASWEQAMQAGAVAVLEKPVRNQQLLCCIEQAMASQIAMCATQGQGPSAPPATPGEIAN